MFRYAPLSHKSLNTLFKNVIVIGENKLPLFSLPSVVDKRIWMTQGMGLCAVNDKNERISTVFGDSIVGVARITPRFITKEYRESTGDEIIIDDLQKFVKHTGIDCNKLREHIVVDKRFGKMVRKGEFKDEQLAAMLQKCILLSPREYTEDAKNMYVSKFDIENAPDEMEGLVFI